MVWSSSSPPGSVDRSHCLGRRPVPGLSLDTLLRWLRLDRWTRRSLTSCLTLKRDGSQEIPFLESWPLCFPAGRLAFCTCHVLCDACAHTDRVAIGAWKVRSSSQCVSATAHKLKMPIRYSKAASSTGLVRAHVVKSLATIPLTLVDWPSSTPPSWARRFFQDPPQPSTVAASSSAPVPPEPIDDRHDPLRLFRGRSWFPAASQSTTLHMLRVTRAWCAARAGAGMQGFGYEGAITGLVPYSRCVAACAMSSVA